MSGGPNQRGRGFRGSPRGSPGRGRGQYRGRGRGRGGGGGGGGRGRGGYHTLDDMDDMFLVAENNQHNPGTASPRGRGRGNGQFSNRGSGSNTPRGRGRGASNDYQSPRGRGRGGIGDLSPRGRGQGRGGSKLRPDAPLSGLLYQERPFLRPIIFVPSVYTKTLFQEEEDIFKAIVEDVGEEEQSHVPTAERVFRVFSGNVPQVVESNSDGSGDEDELEEIDFNDMEKLLEGPARPLSADVQVVEEKFSGIFLGPSPAGVPSSSSPEPSTTAMATDDLTLADPSGELVQPIPTNLPRFDIDIESSTNTIIKPERAETSQDESGTPMDIGESSTQSPTQSAAKENNAPPEEFTGFYIDTEPSPIHAPHRGANPRLLQDDDDEVIVYVAPHPRTGRVTPLPSGSDNTSTPSLPSTSILTGTTVLPSTTTSISTPPRTSATPARPAPTFTSVSFSFTPTPKKPRVFTTRSKTKGALKSRRQEAHAVRRRMEQQAVFGSFGAMMSEAQLRGGRRDPRWEDRRRGDSDVDWGESDVDDGDVGGAGADTGLAEGMELDPDLQGDEEAMRRFAKGMGRDGAGGAFVTMDDIADGQLMRMEDEEDGRDVGSSGDDEEEDGTTADEAEVDAIVRVEEEVMMAEPWDVELEESDDDDSDDDGESPRTGFQARLERLRKTRARGKQPQAESEQVALDESDSGDDYDDDHAFLGRADEDEDFIEEIQMFLDENRDIIMGRDRKSRNKVFRAVRNGAFEDLDNFKPARKSKDKYKDLTSELQQQWQKDRDKKAENKRLRALARLELAADPMSQKKGGQKGRKAMLAAAKLDPTIRVLPNRVIDLTTLVQQIRRFLADIGGPVSMSLPPTDKWTRKNVHEMAIAFNLKSVSKGKGDARYTTLMKTTRSGVYVDEKKVAKIVRLSGGGGGGGGGGGEFMGSNGRGRAAAPTMPRHKEGEEVGKAAPKIGGTNIGFKMLEMMGWSEGQRIGITGGLQVPLTAVIKNTKLGLGATK